MQNNNRQVKKQKKCEKVIYTNVENGVFFFICFLDLLCFLLLLFYLCLFFVFLLLYYQDSQSSPGSGEHNGKENTPNPLPGWKLLLLFTCARRLITCSGWFKLLRV